MIYFFSLPNFFHLHISPPHSYLCYMKDIFCAFNGEKGAFADVAVRSYFGDGVASVPCGSFGDVFALVYAGQAAFGMVPIENSTTGSIYQNYDNFSRYEGIAIVGAVAIRIRHSLLAPFGTALEDIRTVYSHPQGFYQCSSFLKDSGWNLVETVSTATGAKLVGEMDDRSCAAIADASNAGFYNLEVLKDSIEDNPENYTRFVVIASRDGTYGSCPEILEKGIPNKVSFTFTAKNEVGSLYACLGVCKDAELNLTKIESRPIPGCPWSYRFFADATLPVKERAASDESASSLTGTVLALERAVAAFKTEFALVAEDIRVLGMYRE